MERVKGGKGSRVVATAEAVAGVVNRLQSVTVAEEQSEQWRRMSVSSSCRAEGGPPSFPEEEEKERGGRGGRRGLNGGNKSRVAVAHEKYNSRETTAAALPQWRADVYTYKRRMRQH